MQSFYILAAVATAVCCLFAVWTLRFDQKKRRRGIKKEKLCGCDCTCGDRRMMETVAAVERQVGGSMMEQLVPEITTHTLSYLDYTSLCRLSMTNSEMRRAANDDGAWKTLYHKDFTTEQDTVTPINGWKSYYAATKAIVSVNAEFYNIIRERSLPAMGRLWLNADYVKCIHGSGELFTGYGPVIDSWGLQFNWVDQGGEGVDSFEIRDVRARVTSDMAWVTMEAYVDAVSGPFHVTNIFERHHGRWYMVHHHSSLTLDAHPTQHNFFGF